MEKEKAIEYLNNLDTKEVEIIDLEKASENEYLKKEVGKAVGQAYQAVDDVLGKLNLEKKGKTSETVEYHITSFNQKLEKLSGIEKDYAKLLEETEELKKNGVTDETIIKERDKYKNDYTELQTLLSKTKEETQKTIEEKSKEFNSFKINTILKNSVPQLDGDAEYINFKVNKAISDIKDNYEITLTDNGLEIMKNHEKYKPEDLLKESLKDLIGKPKVGLYGKPPINKVTISNAATKGELLDVVAKQCKEEGLSITQEAYHNRHAELLKENNYKDLPN